MPTRKSPAEASPVVEAPEIEERREAPRVVTKRAVSDPEQAKAVEAPRASVWARVKEGSPLHDVQSAGVRFGGQWMRFPEEDPRVSELRDCEFLEVVAEDPFA